jgi:protein ImuB
MVFACMFVPDFPVAAVVRSESRLRDHGVAVLAGTPPLLRVCAINEKGRAEGAEINMTKLQAEAFRGLQLRLRSPAAEEIAHAALLDCAQSFSPRVEDTADDCVILDLSGLDRLFGPAASIARELARRAAEVGLETQVAVASNPDAAMHAAIGFPGITVMPGTEAQRLGDLPIDVLLNATGPAKEAGQARASGCAEAQTMLETLDRWGVRTFRALAALPAAALSERLGQAGLCLQQLARGAMQRTLAPADPPLKFEETAELEYPIALLDPLAFVLSHMLENLCARLASRSLAANALRIRLELDPSAAHDDGGEAAHADAEPCGAKTGHPRASDSAQADAATTERRPALSYQRALHLPVPMLNAKTFLKLLQLELSAHPPGAPITKIWLSLEPVRPRAAQAGLFLPLAPEPEKLELTLARISGIVGEARAGAAQILETHRPDAFRMQRFAPPPAVYPPTSDREQRRVPLTALRLLRPPLRASVVLHGGVPVRLTAHADLRGEIVWAAGPWQASGEWWSEQTWAREEWDIVVDTGRGAALYRIFREPATGQWFVHGSYD